jgi:D-alanine-D-alanine ligase-like ATP-grasp enzyme
MALACMRLCTLLASYERSDSPFRDIDPYPDPSLWGPEHAWETHLIDKATAARTVRRLCQRGFDAFVNLCDGTWEEDQAGVEVIVALERQGQAYTGSDPRFYEPTRTAMKLVCADVGVDTPRHVLARGRADAAACIEHLRFPLLVKPENGYGSVGLTAASRVTDEAGLLARVDAMIEGFGGALIEEFIAGREYTVLVAEPGPGESTPRAYPPLEVRFPAGETFKHFDLKWHGYGELASTPVEDAALAERLMRAAALMFAGMRGVGYARCDIRVDAEGRLFMLDVNANPGIFYPPATPGAADLILRRADGGHAAFLEHILAAALRRRDARRRKWAVVDRPGLGPAVVATVDIAAGERVLVGEEEAFELVSRDHVLRTWPAWRRRVFERHARPLTAEVHALWQGDPDSWLRAGHSCDPSTTPVGLDFVARRAISRGEAITVDHAALGGAAAAALTCRCGAPNCRGTAGAGR